VKITGVESFLVAPRWLFVRVATDDGIVGWGEPIVEGRAATVQAAVAELAAYLIDADPLRIEHHWQILTKGGFYRGGPVLSSAVAGIDQALWDIAGKAHGVPVHELLGGPVRDMARVYAWIGGDDPEDVADAARAQVDAGFTAVKMNGSGSMRALETRERTAEIVGRAEAVRAALGDQRDLVIDFHGRVSGPMARRLLPALEPLHPLFVEEPILPELSFKLAALVRCSPVPLAVGERLYSRTDFRDVLPTGIAVAQPDLSHAGGISEVRRIAAMAEVVRGRGGAPLPARADRARRQPPDRVRDAQLPDSGAEPGHPLQHHSRPARLRDRREPVRVRKRDGAAAAGARAWCGGGRGGRPARGRDRSSLAQPGVGPRRRVVRGVVSSDMGSLQADSDLLLSTLRDRRVLAIVRGRDRDASFASVRALVDEGIGVLEVSLIGADALGVLRDSVEQFGDAALVGAGTVQTVEQLDAALAAGAAFVVAPALTPAVRTGSFGSGAGRGRLLACSRRTPLRGR
jgi:galactonate dehydratase